MFDRNAVAQAVARRGAVARVVIAAVAGSSPREAGASMLVWADGQSGTIGGGALEWQAAQTARAMLSAGGARVDRVALGPNIGQCCGGAVVLVSEVWDAARLAAWLPQDGLMARALGDAAMPLQVARIIARARDRGVVPTVTLTDGWLVEPVATLRRDLWIWGAGHVGRAIVAVLAPLPDLAMTWVDTAADRFPYVVEDGVTQRLAPDPGTIVTEAPQDAAHLILTYSHALDLDLCHRLLTHGFAHCGLIGSTTKWARFRNRLAALGHRPEAIARIDCPIGDPAFGKHPQAIAIGVAASVMSHSHSRKQEKRA
ncbi:MAG: xanthine dehydrogenase accessory protein XdhC [Gemmobacter sp.]|nr:xanthine dehydrogenase accessory protein XdhC [Gemmobacter sp.]